MTILKIAACSPVAYFADDVHGVCACGAAIVWRPHSPADAMKVCVRCAIAMTEAQPFEVVVTEETRRELALYYAQTGGAH